MQEEYERINDFPMFVDKYFRALKKLRDNSKLIEDTVSIFKRETSVLSSHLLRRRNSLRATSQECTRNQIEYTRFTEILERHGQPRS